MKCADMPWIGIDDASTYCEGFEPHFVMTDSFEGFKLQHAPEVATKLDAKVHPRSER